jgi:hypothetical protein
MTVWAIQRVMYIPSILQEITMIVTVLPEVVIRGCPSASEFPHKSIHKERHFKGLHKKESHRVEALARTYFSITR